MTKTPLQYEISCWKQAAKCRSNYSQQLRIRVGEFTEETFTGTRISVVHDVYGVLFAYVVDAKGDIVVDVEGSIMSTDEILLQLRRYGFFIEYPVKDQISQSQLAYLRVLDGLGYEKIRVMGVQSSDSITTNIVAFQTANKADWLNNDYTAKFSEFTEALFDGSAINLTGISNTRNYHWDWLTYVANIKDIIDNYSEDDGE